MLKICTQGAYSIPLMFVCQLATSSSLNGVCLKLDKLYRFMFLHVHIYVYNCVHGPGTTAAPFEKFFGYSNPVWQSQLLGHLHCTLHTSEHNKSDCRFAKVQVTRFKVPKLPGRYLQGMSNYSRVNMWTLHSQESFLAGHNSSECKFQKLTLEWDSGGPMALCLSCNLVNTAPDSLMCWAPMLG